MVVYYTYQAKISKLKNEIALLITYIMDKTGISDALLALMLTLATQRDGES